MAAPKTTRKWKDEVMINIRYDVTKLTYNIQKLLQIN